MLKLSSLGFKPSEVSGSLMDSCWQRAETEWVAENICKLARFRNDDEWHSFTWEDYVEFCSHSPSYKDHVVLKEFVKTGYLELHGDAFHFTSKLLGVYLQHSGKK